MGRTTSAQKRTRAQKGANNRTSEKCSFWIFAYLVIWLAEFPCSSTLLDLPDVWSNIFHLMPPTALWFNCYETWALRMTSRLHSAKTLEEGMNQVGFGDVKARKRELEAKIADA